MQNENITCLFLSGEKNESTSERFFSPPLLAVTCIPNDTNSKVNNDFPVRTLNVDNLTRAHINAEVHIRNVQRAEGHPEKFPVMEILIAFHQTKHGYK